MRKSIIIGLIAFFLFVVGFRDETVTKPPQRFSYVTEFFHDAQHNLIVMYAPGPHAELHIFSWYGINLDTSFHATEKWPPDYPWIVAMPQMERLGWTRVVKPDDWDGPEFLGRFDTCYIDQDTGKPHDFSNR